MKKTVIFHLAFLLFILSAQSQTKFKLTGEILYPGEGHQVVIYNLNTNQSGKAEVTGNTFTYNGELSEPGDWSINVFLAGDNKRTGAAVFCTGQDVHLKFLPDGSVEISGSKDTQDEYYKIQQPVGNYRDKMMETNELLETAMKNKSPDTGMLKIKKQAYVDSCYQVPIDFIKANPKSIVSLKGLWYLQKGKKSGKQPITLNDLEKLYASLDPAVRNSTNGKYYAAILDTYKEEEKVTNVRNDSIKTKATPEIGQLCPDFTLSDVQHYSNTKISRDDFKGKWLILDFWARTCVSCIKSFPKINDLQDSFKNDIKFLLVGINGNGDNNLPEMYEKLRKKMNLHLSIAYDSVIWKQFNVISVPHVIIIDPDGIVRAITSSSEITHENLQQLINGQPADFTVKKELEYFKQENLPTAYLSWEDAKNKVSTYRSVISEAGMQPRIAQINQPAKGIIQRSFEPLGILYRYAYFAKEFIYFNDPDYAKVSRALLLELKDSSLFSYIESKGIHMYNYCLTVPSAIADSTKMFQFMQEDLKRNFGYTATVENRQMPCWNLVATDKAKQKLKTKGGPKNMRGNQAGYQYLNYPVQELMFQLDNYLGLAAPIIDKTGINRNIDITIDALMTDFEDVKRALKKNGLELVPGKKEMKVLVIRDGN